MLNLLCSRLLSPDAIALEPERRQGRRLKAYEVSHLHREPGRGIDNTSKQVRIFNRRMIGFAENEVMKQIGFS
ncbi:hypothetical protein N182_37870 [Sinorhizobium sp. GL2]|nr:hypothetical protein N182_37870 [Sinorhizobium sp. GL2]